MKKHSSVKIPFDYKTTKQDLMQALAGVPGHAKPSVSVSRGDRHGESTSYAIEFSWDEDLLPASPTTVPSVCGGGDSMHFQSIDGKGFCDFCGRTY